MRVNYEIVEDPMTGEIEVQTGMGTPVERGFHSHAEAARFIQELEEQEERDK